MPKLRIGPPPKPPERKKLNRASRDKEMFEQLLPCLWRDILIPIVSLKVSFDQDLHEHKYYGKDGASIEATGRNPLHIEATIPFFNGIVPGKNEKWGVLYPNVFRDFLKAFTDRKTGIFQHPELGEIQCKPQSLSFNHNPERRDGIEVTASWLETILDGNDTPNLFSTSPIEQATVAALDLDASLTDIRALAPDMPQFEESFSSMLGKIRGIVDSTTAEINLIKSRPAAILANLKRIQQSSEGLHSALTAPLDNSVERNKELFRDFDEKQTQSRARGRVIRRYIVQSRIALCGLSGILPNNSADDLVQLNPRLLNKPDLPAGTVVRYYA